MKYYQACYGKPSNNWQILNVSKDTPPSMISFFENLGNSCTPQNIGKDILLDKNNNPVILYELISAENIICVLRARYGERDNFGRPKMFAHGFMVSAEDVFDDPSNILSIDDLNFHYSDSETINIPSDLICEDKMSILSALSICQIDKSKWNLMMKCVYAMLFSPTDYPLYIKCDNNMKTIKAIIYCILYALPISLRYLLSFSNANSLLYAKFKRIMFVDQIIESGDMFFDLETGTTNLSTELAEVEQYPERFPSYYAFVDMTMAQFAEYCKSIQQTLALLSMGYVSNIEEVNLAHTIVSGIEPIKSYSDDELTKYLLKILVVAPLQNRFVDDYLAEVLNIFDLRSIIPNDNIMKRIEFRNDKTSSEKYAEICKKIRMRVLIAKGNTEVVTFLNGQYEKSRNIFDEWYRLVINIPNGKEAVYIFFDEKIKNCNSFEIAIKLFREVQTYCKDTDLWKKCAKQFYQIALDHIISTSLTQGDYELELINLRKKAEEMTGTGNQAWIDSIILTIKKEFWNRFNYSRFEFCAQCISNCRTMYISENNNPTIDLLIGIYETVESYKSIGRIEDYHVIEDAIAAYKNRNQLHSKQYSEMQYKITNYVFDALYKRDGHRHFCMWLEIIRIDKSIENPIPQLFNMDLSVVSDFNYFEMALKESHQMQKIAFDIKKWLCDAIDDAEFYQLNPEIVKIMKKEIKIIDDYKKELVAEEKQKIKEQRQNEKNDENFSRNEDSDIIKEKSSSNNKELSHSKKSLFGNLFGGKKK